MAITGRGKWQIVVLTMDLQPPLEDKGKRKQIHLPLNQEASNCSSVGSAPHRL